MALSRTGLIRATPVRASPFAANPFEFLQLPSTPAVHLKFTFSALSAAAIGAHTRHDFA
jgi:hypothetical protein